MPRKRGLPNEHAARQRDPKLFFAFRRAHKQFPPGVDAIFGIHKTPGGKHSAKVQSLRFRANKWSPARARAWLIAHGFRDVVEPATRRTAVSRKRAKKRTVRKKRRR